MTSITLPLTTSKIPFCNLHQIDNCHKNYPLTHKSLHSPISGTVVCISLPVEKLKLTLTSPFISTFQETSSETTKRQKWYSPQSSSICTASVFKTSVSNHPLERKRRSNQREVKKGRGMRENLGAYSNPSPKTVTENSLLLMEKEKKTETETKMGTETETAGKYEWSPLSFFLGTEGRPSMVFNDTVNYFAFGSNLNLQKLTSRSGGIKILGAEPGQVSGHRLAFNLLCFPPFEPTMAGLEPDSSKNSEAVHGLLVTLRRAQYELLYLSEGGASGPGRAYIEREVTVETYNGKKVKAIAFQTNPKSPQKLPKWLELPPSKRYRDLILNGAETAGLDERYISQLKKVKAFWDL